MINEKPEAQSNSISRTMREKEWEEIGLEEKIDRLKKDVDSLTRRNRYIDRQLGLLMYHKHNDHEVLINIGHAER